MARQTIIWTALPNGYTVDGEVLLSIHVVHAADGGSDRLHFGVHDSGIGIPAAGMDRLFKTFSQVDASTTRQFGGTGLGLAISQRMVDLMGGHIRLQSTEGQGSVFTLELPTESRTQPDTLFAETTPPAAPAGEAAPVAAAAALKVLVVDDHPVNQKLATALLQKMGHEVQQAANGLEALERVRGEAFDLVLMDLHMPEMDGLESTRQIRRLPPPRGRVPVVALTANAMEAAQRETEAAGFDNFLTKPLKVQALQAVLAQCQTAPHRRSTGDADTDAPAAAPGP